MMTFSGPAHSQLKGSVILQHEMVFNGPAHSQLKGFGDSAA